MMLNKSPILAIVIGVLVFAFANVIAESLLSFFQLSISWLSQVLMKAILILLSLAGIHYFLNVSLAEAGFKRPSIPWKKGGIILRGMALGALATVLIFFTPAKGIPFVQELGLLKFLLVIVLWSSIAEEIFIRGLLQTYLRDFSQIKVASFSISVWTCATIFGIIHLSLLFQAVDYLTIGFTVLTAFLLGLLAGIYREKYDSILPSILVHMSFNIGGIVVGILIAISYKIITGELPSH